MTEVYHFQFIKLKLRSRQRSEETVPRIGEPEVAPLRQQPVEIVQIEPLQHPRNPMGLRPEKLPFPHQFTPGTRYVPQPDAPDSGGIDSGGIRRDQSAETAPGEREFGIPGGTQQGNRPEEELSSWPVAS